MRCPSSLDGEGVADFEFAVGVIVVEHANLLAVLEFTFKDAAAVGVGLYPAALSATLVVDAVLGGKKRGDEE